uniref:Uncharacterized protein n=1 Tax=Siphoviridae sp. ctVif31 TaxID=2825532 RepID=A0A8S5Q417_9CAUD|nr:MAG TPA: hypothetical protein [Siphoviridae sp. ctVif31]DAY83413.1 MAG TPA: hypothetical protein [Caudoviricetes sp.]
MFTLCVLQTDCVLAFSHILSTKCFLETLRHLRSFGSAIELKSLAAH